MEITVYALFSIFTFLLFFITYAKKYDHGGVNNLMLKLFTGFAFMILAVFSMKLDFLLVLGMNVTVYPIDLITDGYISWHGLLFLFYFLFGLLQVAFAFLDGKGYVNQKRIEKEMKEDDVDG
jgi:hypothetical protein